MTTTTTRAVQRLAWAQANGCPWVPRTCALVAAGGRLDVLKWARAHDCPWDESLESLEVDCCALAAQGGHLEVLKWLREHGCPWDEWTCERRSRRAPGGVEVGAGTPLPVGRTDAPMRRAARTPGALAVGDGPRCSLIRADTARCASDALSAAPCSGGRSIHVLKCIASRFRALQLNIYDLYLPHLLHSLTHSIAHSHHLFLPVAPTSAARSTSPAHSAPSPTTTVGGSRINTSVSASSRPMSASNPPPPRLRPHRHREPRWAWAPGHTPWGQSNLAR